MVRKRKIINNKNFLLDGLEFFYYNQYIKLRKRETMTKEKALEKIEIIYKLNGDFDHATKYITGLYGLTPDFWKENFDFISSKMIAKYPNLFYGGIV